MASPFARRFLLPPYRFVRYELLPFVGHLIMSRRSPNRLLQQWPTGEIALGPKVCVYVHWDGGGDVRDHVMHHVRSLAQAGLSIVFVTNSGFLRPAAMAALQQVCAGVLIRANVGYDFGAWREGFRVLQLPRPNTEMVLMANDSVYGPISPISNLLGVIDLKQADFWGCTESWQTRYHLQSYLMAFSPRVVASDQWKKFWDAVRPTWAKSWLVRLYEIGLTQTLLKAGFTCRAIWPYESLIKDLDPELLMDHTEGGPNLADPTIKARQYHTRHIRNAGVLRLPLNPTSDLWRQLVQARFPFIKRELLRENPTHVPDVAEWREVAAAHSTTNLAPIERDLQRTLKNRTP
jgi:hypothetical protein